MQESMRRASPMTVGAVTIGAVIAFSSLAVVRAERAAPDKSRTFVCRTGTGCVIGQSNASAAGVSGTSVSGYGVIGSSNAAHLAGVEGNSSGTGVGVGGFGSGSGAAVSAANTGSGAGVTALAVNNEGVYAVSQSTADYGIYGEDNATGGGGVYGFSSGSSGLGVVGQSNGTTGAALSGITNGNPLLLNLENELTLAACIVDGGANLTCTGSISGGALTQRHRNASGQRVVAYAAQSATATMEDVGEGRLSNGIANVSIPSDFASVIDRGRYYYVFLTPLGDTHGLYVSTKTAAGFQVRESMHGRSNVAFDYRIVAKPADANDERLPLAPRMQRIRMPVHRPVAVPQLRSPAQ